MTKDFLRAEEGHQSPVISIQSDWDDVIFSKNQEIWILCKFLGNQGVYAKLTNHDEGKITSTSPDFSIVSLTQNKLQIKYNPSGHVFVFIPPLKTFSNIHKKKVISVNVGDKGMGVSVCSENNLLVWSSVTGDILRTLSGHVFDVYKCRFFPSGLVVLSGGADMQLKIWSATTGDCPVTLNGHKACINDFCVVDIGRNIISVSKDGTAKLWDCGKANCLATILKTNSTLNCCSIGILPEHIKTRREDPENEREVGTNNKLLIVGTEEGQVYGVAVYSREMVFTITVDSAVNVVLILQEKIIIGCQNGKIHIFKLSDLIKPEKIIHESGSPVLSGCVYKDGVFMGRNDGSVIYYDCVTFMEKRISLTGSDCDPISDISYSGDKIFTACRDGKIRQYSIVNI